MVRVCFIPISNLMVSLHFDLIHPILLPANVFISSYVPSPLYVRQYVSHSAPLHLCQIHSYKMCFFSFKLWFSSHL